MKNKDGKKQTLAVIYGGDSTERDISVITAVQAMKTLKREYDLYPLLLEDNAFYHVDKADEIKSYIGKGSAKKRVFIDKDGVFSVGIGGIKRVCKPDCFLVCTHGGSGENGALQGYLDVIGLPYTSCGVAASATGMDKALSKVVFSSLGLKVLPYTVIQSGDGLKRVEDEIGYPVMVKPLSQGSSIGVAAANDMKELKEVADVAFSFDERVICERALTDFTELNCAVLTKDGEIIASELEQPLSWEKFLSFEEKYLKSGGKMSGGGRIYPADVPESVRNEVIAAAKKAYVGIGAKGIVRADFLLDNTDGKVYINEVNTVPGSLATYLFEKNGMDYTAVVKCAVDDAILRSKTRKTTKFGSNVLDVYGKSSANACKMHGKIL